ncbi:hypothetical protein D1007_52445 [Hordeum vulgare]|nr:hypothetical protein D1007_52445 [Hordeum vulgare]
MSPSCLLLRCQAHIRARPLLLGCRWSCHDTVGPAKSHASSSFSSDGALFTSSMNCWIRSRQTSLAVSPSPPSSAPPSLTTLRNRRSSHGSPKLLPGPAPASASSFGLQRHAPDLSLTRRPPRRWSWSRGCYRCCPLCGRMTPLEPLRPLTDV